MKQLTFISFIFLFSFATSSDLKGSTSDAEHKSEIVHRFNDLKEEHFKAISLITFSQYLSMCPHEEIAKQVKNVVDIAHKCVANEQDPECLKPVPTIILDEMCKKHESADACGPVADCCNKTDPGRNECFLSFKKSVPGLIPPYHIPAPEVLCQQFQEAKGLHMEHRLYEMSRRHPFLYGPTVLALALEIEHAVEHCCKEANSSVCLEGKLPLIRKRIHFVSKRNTYGCEILKKYGERTFKKETFAILSQKFPKAPFAEIQKIEEDISHVHMECCAGDMIECADDRAEVVNYICSKQDIFSSKIKDCCEKPVVERSECVPRAPFDDKPEGLPSIAEKYGQDQEMCKHFTEEPNAFMKEFLYEYSRRHQDFSSQMLLRNGKTFQSTLTECCKKETASECYNHAEEKFRSQIQETQELVKKNCGLLASVGEVMYLKYLLGRYSRKMLQMPIEVLIEVSKDVAAAGSKCCQETEARHMPCLEGYMNMMIQNTCARLEATPVHENVTHCCSVSYVDRRPCFSNLEGASYKPAEFNPELFTFHEDMCTAPAETQQMKELTMLVNLIKLKPTATDEEVQKIVTDFTDMVHKCCAAEQHEACFGEEDAKLIAKIKAFSGIELDSEALKLTKGER
ncbi:albumin-like [Carettochelys insculpta]|uniref:albumin-like n=1 Tax=Carettochelys insculpta TaxID=44489 RepID=UPI003EB844CB